MDRNIKEIYFQKVLKEPFARLLNIKLKDVDEGYALCEMEYVEDMDNLYGMMHGGAIFSLIDEAFEVSANSGENVAYALDMNVTYLKAPKKHTILVAESKIIEKTRGKALFFITVRDDEGLIATCKALASVRKERIPFKEVT